MSDQLDEMDRELLGETGPSNAIEKSIEDEAAHTLTAMSSQPAIVSRAGLVSENVKLELSPDDDQYRNSKKRESAPSPATPDDEKPIAKKRIITKTRKAAVNVSCEGQDDHNGEQEPQTPSPKKRRTSTRKKSKVDADEAVTPSKGGDMTVRNTPRQRTAPKALAAPRGIPASWEVADDADKMLVEMKDAGKDWGTIREAWKNATGSAAAASTLPNRYNRIKVNMMRLKDGEAAILLAAKKQVEAELWTHVANEMASRGTDKYAPAFLQKKYKEFEDLAAASGTTLEDIVEQQATAAGSSAPSSQPTASQPTNTQPTQLTDADIMAGKAIDAFVEPQSDAGGSQ